MALLPEAVAGGSLGHLTHSAQVHTKVNRVIDVKADFNAVGDGAVDDTTAIQNAITAAGVGGQVYLPPGTYMISAALQGEDSLRLFGAGSKVSILKVASGNVATHMLNLASDTDCLIEDLGFDGSSHTVTVTGIRTNTSGTVKNLTVRRCYFVNILPKTVASYGTTSGAMWLWTADGIDIIENEIVDCGRGILIDDPTGGRCNIIGNRITNSALDISSSGIYIKRASPNTPVDNARVVIAYNYVQGCQRDPSDVTPYTGNGQEGHGINVLRVKGVRIIGNTCVANGRGILCSYGTWGTVIQGNLCQANTDAGIRCEPGITDTDVTLGAAGVARGLMIIGNECRDSGSATQHQGYYGQGLTVSYAAGTTISGNIVHDNMHAGINTDSVSTVIVGNQSYNNWKGTVTPTGPTTKGGIRVQGGATVNTCVIVGNHCYDNQTTKTQEYGLTLASSGTGHIVQSNMFSGNSIGEIDGVTKIRHGFYGTPPIDKPALTYSRTGESAAAAQLRAVLSSLGLVTDSTVA